MKKKIVCFGDSITKGHPGITYLKYFNNKKKYKNYGLSGDTLLGMHNRLNKFLNSNKVNNTEGILIGIGANDVIQPYLNNYSWLWKIRVKMLLKRGSVPCYSNSQFKDEYTNMVKTLKNSNKFFVIFSIPYLETNEHLLNEKIKEYNKIIKRICLDFNVPFIDYYSWQEQEKNKMKNTNYSFMSKNPLLVGADTALTSYFQLADHISNKRNLGLTIDGCHLNHHSAKGLARMIEETYKTIE
ncbi:MAG: GDSL-type esterase/lipase family protein [Bacilli bacterium]